MRILLSRPFTDALGLTILAAVPYVAILIALPAQRGRATDVFVVFVGGLLLIALVRITNASRREARSTFDRAARPAKSSPEQLPELARMERDVVLATAKRLDSPHRVRPLLRDIAELRLAAGRGIDLRLDRVDARELLGEELWELVDPDRQDEPPPKLDLDRLERAVATLEAI